MHTGSTIGGYLAVLIGTGEYTIWVFSFPSQPSVANDWKFIRWTRSNHIRLKGETILYKANGIVCFPIVKTAIW